jgi:hypothetical protein
MLASDDATSCGFEPEDLLQGPEELEDLEWDDIEENTEEDACNRVSRWYR